MVLRYELDWYVRKLERGDPFASLLWGDGEFWAASGKRVGQAMAHGEVVTQTMVEELRAALWQPAVHVGGEETFAGTYHGTDPHLIEPWTYGGNDKEFVQAAADRVKEVVRQHAVEWVDGTIWDEASRTGSLGPLIRTLCKREVVLVGNDALLGITFLRFQSVAIPRHNAYAQIGRIEESVLERLRPGMVCVICAGMTAIPLIARLRKLMPNVTYLDLGSVFDVFVGLGSDRGWRRELYAEPSKRTALIRKHLEGA